MYRFIDFNGTVTDQLSELRNGLLSDPKCIPSFFIYDEQGSRLYEQICSLPEYYLTRKEVEILNEYAEEIASLFENECAVVELGSGNAGKTRILIDSWLKRQSELRYYPVDISKDILMETSRKLCRMYRDLVITACCGDYFDSLDYLKDISGPKLILWLGSSIGNFDKKEAAEFLKEVKRRMVPGDGLLIGVDLRKNSRILENAYNDSRGITSRYHLNCLERFNREFGANFNPCNFYHRSFYDRVTGSINAYIISKCDQWIAIDDFGLELPLRAEERIFNERSCKYSIAEIMQLAENAGVKLIKQWLDKDGFYSVNLFC
ncbi:MAG: L-histidine N(alpha)-methyltransferase [Desulfobacterales bacterium]